MTEELGVGGEVWSLFCTERDWGVDCATVWFDRLVSISTSIMIPYIFYTLLKIIPFRTDKQEVAKLKMKERRGERYDVLVRKEMAR